MDEFCKDESVVAWIKHIESEAHFFKLNNTDASLIDAWETWFPSVKAYYEANQARVQEDHASRYGDGEKLKGAFPGFAQASCTCNLGPTTVTPMHRDAENLSFGICMVSAFGDFEWQNGGEIFLLEPRVVIQLRPGDLLMFPSASITHGNFALPEGADQYRYSFTCYTAAALFQWVGNGMALVKTAIKQGKRPAKADWEGGWGLYPLWSELEEGFSRQGKRQRK